MSEAGTHIAIARVRSGPTMLTDASEAAVLAALAEVPDPELPVLSIVELGMVHRVEVAAGAIRVVILPTFIGCPAIDAIRASIADRLAAFGRPVAVETSFEVPWTSERISPAGRRALAAAGIAPPGAGTDVHCPYCASERVVMDSAFGPTQCRSLYYCRVCRQPFEAMKTI